MATDRSKYGLAAFLRSLVGNEITGPRMDYLAAYQCRAVSQNSDGTLELIADDTRLGVFSSVPIRYGVPGVTATVAGGARVLLEFAGGDPQKPIATVWESASVTQLTVVASAIALSNGTADTVLVRYADLKTLLDAQTHLGNLGYPTGVPVVAVPSTVGSSVPSASD